MLYTTTSFGIRFQFVRRVAHHLRGGCAPSCAIMIISKKNRREICKYLFQEGVLYAKKDYNLAKHPEVDVPNLQVIKLMQSFKSREYVRETFAWQYYYWYLTNDGIEFLRTFLNLPSEIVPATLKKSARPPARPFGSGPPGGHHGLREIDLDLGIGTDTVEVLGLEALLVRAVTRVAHLLNSSLLSGYEFSVKTILLSCIDSLTLVSEMFGSELAIEINGSGSRPGFGRGGGGYGAAPPS
ncbi:hypothetical protein ZIOFF_059192 [Zingiber officinale]|uniref:Plectin/eS10 N-terminal domain-containing protein n=1 Tax=Zingiber officinale TaxID=94328 RepID=A0A8J5F941_ZINOF|nr:hypothetical protein ZIOFF_059192 [Zingiber officinale]